MPKKTADNQVHADPGYNNNHQQFGKNRSYDFLEPIYPHIIYGNRSKFVFLRNYNQYKGKIRLPTGLESFGLGVMEYWGVKKKDIDPLVITPMLHYSNTPKLIEIESYRDGLYSFGL